MRKVKFLMIAIFTVFIQSCNNNKEMGKTKAIDTANMDLSVMPGDDFYEYANGGWIKSHPVPADKSRYGAFDQLMDENEKQLQELVDDLLDSKSKRKGVEEKIATFYRTGMDSAAIEKSGVSVLNDELKKIESINTKVDIEKSIAHLHQLGITPGFQLYGAADDRNSSMTITQLHQGGLGLPDRDYYLSENDRFVKIRKKYIEHVAKIFVLAGEDVDKAKADAEIVFNLEKRLAEVSKDRLALRDPIKNYNKITVSELSKMAPEFNWRDYFGTVGLSSVKELIVGQPEFISGFGNVLSKESVSNWKTYLKWNLLNETASYLNSDFVNQNFEFYGKVLSGTPEMKPRWKRVLNTTSGYLGEAVGQIYVKKYFPPEAKERMLKLVENLRLALGNRIRNLSWMSEGTKENALEKLDAITVKIGYPDKWKDYSRLEVAGDAYVLNVLRAAKFHFEDMISKIDKPVDKTEWHMPPQIVNAYYNPTQNEIVFPAGILQPPFFYFDADDAVNYGAIGVVIGHEMTHGFDDQGRLYDKDGNLNTWWTDEDSKLFKKRTQVLVEQFNQFIVLDTIHANGEYTLGENIADLGGINVAYTAFLKTKQGKDLSMKIDGFTAAQRFFLSYAHLWGQNIRDKEILRRTQEDVHSLGHFRVIGPLRNVEAFYEVFEIKPSDKMYLPKEERAIIW